LHHTTDRPPMKKTKTVSIQECDSQPATKPHVIFNEPTVFSEFIIHKPLCRILSSYQSPEDLPMGMLIVGTPLCGKRTLIHAFINHLVQKPVTRTIRRDMHESMKVEFVHSPYHIEFHLEEYGLTDRYIVGEYIKKILDCQTIDGRIRIYIFYGLETYTLDTQDMFVGLMEKYASSSRFIFTASSTNKIHKRIKTSTVHIRVPMPSQHEIRSYLASKGLSIFDADARLQTILNDGHIGSLRYHSSVNPFDALWKSIRPLIDREDIESVVEMRPLFYEAITLTLPMNELIQMMCRYVVQSCPMHLSNELSKCLQEFSHLEMRMNHLKHDIVCLEYGALLAKRYLHGHFRE